MRGDGHWSHRKVSTQSTSEPDIQSLQIEFSLHLTITLVGDWVLGISALPPENHPHGMLKLMFVLGSHFRRRNKDESS